MDTQTLVMFLCIALLFMVWYSQASLKGRVLCFYHRANRTLVEKKIPLRSKYVTFDGGRYKVNPKRISLVWYTRGIHQFFPTYIPSLTYKWDTDEPLDPTTFMNTWDSPEVRDSATQEDMIKAFSKSAAQQIGKKGTPLERLLPWASIGITLILAWMVYQQGQHLALIEQLVKVGK